MAVRLENSMSAAANSGGTFDPERLRLVTQHFRELQGLRWVALGLFQIILMSDVLWSGSATVFSVVKTTAFVAAFIAAILYIPRYYRWRFGCTEPCEDAQRQSRNWLLGASICLAGAAAVLVVWSYGYASLKGISTLPLVAFVGIVCYSILSGSKIMILRRGYLVPILVAAVFLTLYPILIPVSAAELVIWRSMDPYIVWLVWIAVGLGDHITLLRLMPKRVTADEEGDRDDK